MFLIRLRRTSILLLLSVIYPLVSSAQNSNLEPVVFLVYEDTTSTLPFRNISQSDFAGNFKTMQTNTIWHEATHSSLWIRFKMMDTLHVQRFMELTRPNFAEVVYYQPSMEEGIKEYKTGMLSDFGTRPIPIDRFAFPISNGSEWHYIKIRTYHFINTGFHVKTLEQIIDDASSRNLLYTIYVGLMLTVIAGVLFYIYLIRYYSYLLYVGYVLFVSSITLIEKGYYFQILWPNNPIINSYFPLLPFGLSLCMLLFLRGIWIQHKIITILYQITLWGLTVLPFSLALYFFYNDRLAETSILTQIHSLLVGILVIIISLISYVHAEKFLKRPLLLINAGLCILCLSGIIFLAAINNKLPTNFFTDNAIIFGSAIEVGFLTAALIIRSDEIYKRQKFKLSQEWS